jgi:hypothetical protein
MWPPDVAARVERSARDLADAAVTDRVSVWAADP